MSDLLRRAIAVFGQANGVPDWPYGLSVPPHQWREENPERWERDRAERRIAQRVIVEWAEHYGFKRSHKACCPQWLQRKVSQRCRGGRCTHWGAGDSTPDSRWLDHTIGWLLNGKPVAVTSAPYGLLDEDRDRMAWWQAQDDRLRVVTGGSGWYGHDTTQVIVWRTDLVPVIEPAEDVRHGFADTGG
ncbi:hypothetical protein FNQ90_02455 [Streptomyces alkaliphilus]|uniref:Uncharacterized protein n=1 Tax=Streptomyces alkaliphilus TaxID=1472722 RepID=A0A7W3Y063_9ACTN|nr:hypothetical protein [Streptomyces alkaliphilus]MBB0242997.1 hypothetical protein [Streptomyces alkaliphilus]